MCRRPGASILFSRVVPSNNYSIGKAHQQVPDLYILSNHISNSNPSIRYCRRYRLCWTRVHHGPGGTNSRTCQVRRWQEHHDAEASLAVNGSEKLTGEASNSVDRLDLNINARALGYIGVDAIIFVSFRAPIL